MRALVIGASGLVGAELMRVLELQGESATGTYLSRPCGGIYLDVRDAKSVHEQVLDLRPEVVFLPTNISGGADYCESNPEEARALFIDGTRNVLNAAKELDAKVVFFSSDYIFDGKKDGCTKVVLKP